MVCAFCAQGIRKSFESEKAVKSIDVALENKLVTLVLNKEVKIEDQKITKLITDAGYAVEKIERKPHAH